MCHDDCVAVILVAEAQKIDPPTTLVFKSPAYDEISNNYQNCAILCDGVDVGFIARFSSKIRWRSLLNLEPTSQPV